ncbi:hypothetical protein [Nocardia sp. NPDC046763]|uniref:hypothetical protein n=1 Tax=Nocardia sp. NPDC046763 TaxID=3155256 RepID=UPI0033D02A3B
MKSVTSWAQSQPARLYFYPAVVAIVAYLVSRGILDSDTADWITGIVAAGVGIGATETVHASVFSPATVTALLAKAAAAQVDKPTATGGQ